jgi:predicted dehydrogenase
MNRLTRREVLRASAAGVGACALPWLLPSRVWAASPNEKLNIATIGCSGRGASNIQGVDSENIVAMCDVDHKYAAGMFDKHPQAKKYHDFRKMLDEIHGQIDAVVVSTPDHTHAPAGVMAMRLGKHLYCEKPLTHSVYESRLMTDLAREKKLATQLGTQIHAGNNYRRVVELVQAGAVGPIEEVHVWSSAKYAAGDRPTDTPPAPESLNWDLWLGPAPERPYHPAYVPARWRSWWDFGTGALGDFYCHYSDLPFWALKLKYPTSVEAEGPPPHPEGCHEWMIVRYAFPARDNLPAVKLTWYDGGKRPERLERFQLPGWSSGVLFVGRDGDLLANYDHHKLLPEEKFKDYQRPEPTIPASVGHHLEWINACKTGSPTTCNFEYSGPLTEAALLGAVAFRTGEKLNWDAANLLAVGSTNAAPYIRREYRAGWTL